MEGQCQCGKIAFTTPIPQPLKVFFCHCLECRHQSSSAFGISAIFPTFQLLENTSNNINIYIRKTSTGRDLRCHFCKNCGSRIMHEVEGKNTVSIKGGCLNGLTKDNLKSACHIWIKRAIVPIPDDVEKYEEEPPE